MERLSNGPHWVLLCRFPSGDKTFSRFQKGRWRMGILKVSKPFLKHNKMERLSNGPHWVLLRRVPSRDKTFSRFQKGGLPPVKRKVQYPFSTPIKWKDYQLDSLGTNFAASFPGIKKIKWFQKGFSPLLIWNPHNRVLHQLNGKNINWTPGELLSQHLRRIKRIDN